MAIDLSKVTSVVTRPVGNDGGPVPVQLLGSNAEPIGSANPLEVLETGVTAVTDDVAGVGDGQFNAIPPVRFVDFFNGGAEWASVTAAGVTRNVPPGVGRLLEFPAPRSSFAVQADGPWNATGHS